MHASIAHPHQGSNIRHRFVNARMHSQQVISKQQANPLQTFTVSYNGENFLVDPESLSKASLQFRTMIHPYISNPEKMKNIYFEVHGNQFSSRNMNNFLRLCQTLPTDVQNSEMEEICEIAKMFKANEIYNTGFTFIKNSLNPNFSVPDDKYDESCFSIKCNGQEIQAEESYEDMSDEFFEDADSNKYQGKYYSINENKNNNSAENALANAKSISGNIEKRRKHQNLKKLTSLYTVKVENHQLKCPTFKFIKMNQVLFAAKQKNNDIFIGEGHDVHISQRETHIGHIVQNSQNLLINTVNLKNARFNIKYINMGRPNRFSIETSFKIDEKMTTWVPRKPKLNPKTGKLRLNYGGEYHRKALPSMKNIVLENMNGKPSFIVRKKDENVFEVECLPDVNPLIAFSIAVSDIVGPYCNSDDLAEY